MSADVADSQLTSSLFSLARMQLQIQGIRFGALNRHTRGLIIADLLIAGLVIYNGGAYYLWVASLVLLAISLVVAVWALRAGRGAQIGLSIDAIHETGETEDRLETRETLLGRLAGDVQANEPILASQAFLFDKALIFVVIAFVIDVAGQLL
jgi:hypothetical protein